MKELFEKYGVIKTGHFKLTSGKHSAQYINKDAIYSNPMLFDKVVTEMWDKINGYRHTFDIITGPAIAGAVLAAPISLLFYDRIPIYPEQTIFVYPEKINEKMVFRRDYDKVLKHKKVWVVEDIITTGNSVEKTIMAIRDCGGSVVGISAIWNRGAWKPNNLIGCQFLSLISEGVPSYWPDECPYCKENRIPLQDPKE